MSTGFTAGSGSHNKSGDEAVADVLPPVSPAPYQAGIGYTEGDMPSYEPAQGGYAPAPAPAAGGHFFEPGFTEYDGGPTHGGGWQPPPVQPGSAFFENASALGVLGDPGIFDTSPPVSFVSNEDYFANKLSDLYSGVAFFDEDEELGLPAFSGAVSDLWAPDEDGNVPLEHGFFNDPRQVDYWNAEVEAAIERGDWEKLEELEAERQKFMRWSKLAELADDLAGQFDQNFDALVAQDSQFHLGEGSFDGQTLDPTGLVVERDIGTPMAWDRTDHQVARGETAEPDWMLRSDLSRQIEEEQARREQEWEEERQRLFDVVLGGQQELAHMRRLEMDLNPMSYYSLGGGPERDALIREHLEEGHQWRNAEMLGYFWTPTVREELEGPVGRVHQVIKMLDVFGRLTPEEDTSLVPYMTPQQLRAMSDVMAGTTAGHIEAAWWTFADHAWNSGIRAGVQAVEGLVDTGKWVGNTILSPIWDGVKSLPDVASPATGAALTQIGSISKLEWDAQQPDQQTVRAHSAMAGLNLAWENGVSQGLSAVWDALVWLDEGFGEAAHFMGKKYGIERLLQTTVPVLGVKAASSFWRAELNESGTGIKAVLDSVEDSVRTGTSGLASLLSLGYYQHGYGFVDWRAVNNAHFLRQDDDRMVESRFEQQALGLWEEWEQEYAEMSTGGRLLYELIVPWDVLFGVAGKGGKLGVMLATERHLVKGVLARNPHLADDVLSWLLSEPSLNDMRRTFIELRDFQRLAFGDDFAAGLKGLDNKDVAVIWHDYSTNVFWRVKGKEHYPPEELLKIAQDEWQRAVDKVEELGLQGRPVSNPFAHDPELDKMVQTALDSDWSDAVGLHEVMAAPQVHDARLALDTGVGEAELLALPAPSAATEAMEQMRRAGPHSSFSPGSRNGPIIPLGASGASPPVSPGVTVEWIENLRPQGVQGMYIPAPDDMTPILPSQTRLLETIGAYYGDPALLVTLAGELGVTTGRLMDEFILSVERAAPKITDTDQLAAVRKLLGPNVDVSNLAAHNAEILLRMDINRINKLVESGEARIFLDNNALTVFERELRTSVDDLVELSTRTHGRPTRQAPRHAWGGERYAETPPTMRQLEHLLELSKINGRDYLSEAAKLGDELTSWGVSRLIDEAQRTVRAPDELVEFALELRRMGVIDDDVAAILAMPFIGLNEMLVKVLGRTPPRRVTDLAERTLEEVRRLRKLGRMDANEVTQYGWLEQEMIHVVSLLGPARRRAEALEFGETFLPKRGPQDTVPGGLPRMNAAEFQHVLHRDGLLLQMDPVVGGIVREIVQTDVNDVDNMARLFEELLDPTLWEAASEATLARYKKLLLDAYYEAPRPTPRPSQPPAGRPAPAGRPPAQPAGRSPLDVRREIVDVEQRGQELAAQILREEEAAARLLHVVDELGLATLPEVKLTPAWLRKEFGADNPLVDDLIDGLGNWARMHPGENIRGVDRSLRHLQGHPGRVAGLRREQQRLREQYRTLRDELHPDQRRALDAEQAMAESRLGSTIEAAQQAGVKTFDATDPTAVNPQVDQRKLRQRVRDAREKRGRMRQQQVAGQQPEPAGRRQQPAAAPEAPPPSYDELVEQANKEARRKVRDASTSDTIGLAIKQADQPSSEMTIPPIERPKEPPKLEGFDPVTGRGRSRPEGFDDPLGPEDLVRDKLPQPPSAREWVEWGDTVPADRRPQTLPEYEAMLRRHQRERNRFFENAAAFKPVEIKKDMTAVVPSTGQQLTRAEAARWNQRAGHFNGVLEHIAKQPISALRHADPYDLARSYLGKVDGLDPDLARRWTEEFTSYLQDMQNVTNMSWVETVRLLRDQRSHTMVMDEVRDWLELNVHLLKHGRPPQPKKKLAEGSARISRTGQDPAETLAEAKLWERAGRREVWESMPQRPSRAKAEAELARARRKYERDLKRREGIVRQQEKRVSQQYPGSAAEERALKELEKRKEELAELKEWMARLEDRFNLEFYPGEKFTRTDIGRVRREITRTQAGMRRLPADDVAGREDAGRKLEELRKELAVMEGALDHSIAVDARVSRSGDADVIRPLASHDTPEIRQMQDDLDSLIAMNAPREEIQAAREALIRAREQRVIDGDDYWVPDPDGQYGRRAEARIEPTADDAESLNLKQESPEARLARMDLESGSSMGGENVAGSARRTEQVRDVNRDRIRRHEIAGEEGPGKVTHSDGSVSYYSVGIPGAQLLSKAATAAVDAIKARRMVPTFSVHSQSYRQMIGSPAMLKAWDQHLDSFYNLDPEDVQIFTNRFGVNGSFLRREAQTTRVADVAAAHIQMIASDLMEADVQGKYRHFEFYEDLRGVIEAISLGVPEVTLRSGEVYRPFDLFEGVYRHTDHGRMTLAAFRANGEALLNRWDELVPHPNLAKYLSDNIDPSYTGPQVSSLFPQAARRTVIDDATGKAYAFHGYSEFDMRKLDLFFTGQNRYFGATQAELNAHGGFLRRRLDNLREDLAPRWEEVRNDTRWRDLDPNGIPAWRPASSDNLAKKLFPEAVDEPVDIHGLADNLAGVMKELEAARLGVDLGDMNGWLRGMQAVKRNFAWLWMTLVPRYHQNNFMGSVNSAVMSAVRGDNHYALRLRNERVLALSNQPGSGIRVNPWTQSAFSRLNESLRSVGQTHADRLGRPPGRPEVLRGKWNPLRPLGDLTERAAGFDAAVEAYFKQNIWTNEFAGSYAANWRRWVNASDLPGAPLSAGARADLQAAMGLAEVKAVLLRHNITGQQADALLKAQRGVLARADNDAYMTAMKAMRDYRMRNKLDHILDHVVPIHFWQTKNLLFVGGTLKNRPWLMIPALNVYDTWAESWEDKPPSFTGKLHLAPLDALGLGEVWLRPHNYVNPALWAVPQVVSDTRKAWARTEDMGALERFYYGFRDGARNAWKENGYKSAPHISWLTRVAFDENAPAGGKVMDLAKWADEKLGWNAGIFQEIAENLAWLGDPDPYHGRPWLELAGGEDILQMNRTVARVFEYIGGKVNGSKLTRAEINSVAMLLAQDYKDGKFGTPGSLEAFQAFGESLLTLDEDNWTPEVESAVGRVKARRGGVSFVNWLGPAINIYTDDWKHNHELFVWFEEAILETDIPKVQPGASDEVKAQAEGWAAEVRAADEERSRNIQNGMSRLQADAWYEHRVDAVWDEAEAAGAAVFGRRGDTTVVWRKAEDEFPELLGYLMANGKADTVIRMMEAAERRDTNQQLINVRQEAARSSADLAEENRPAYAALYKLDRQLDDDLEKAGNNLYLINEAYARNQRESAELWARLREEGYEFSGTGKLPQHGSTWYQFHYGEIRGSGTTTVVTPDGPKFVSSATSYEKDIKKHWENLNLADGSDNFQQWAELQAADALGEKDRIETQQAQNRWFMDHTLDVLGLRMYDSEGVLNPEFATLNAEGELVADWDKLRAAAAERTDEARETFNGLVLSMSTQQEMIQTLKEVDDAERGRTGGIGAIAPQLVNPGVFDEDAWMEHVGRRSGVLMEYWDERRRHTDIYWEMGPDEVVEIDGEKYSRSGLGDHILRTFGPDALSRNYTSHHDYEGREGEDRVLSVQIGEEGEIRLTEVPQSIGELGPHEEYQYETGISALQKWAAEDLTASQKYHLRQQFPHAFLYVEPESGERGWWRFVPDMLTPEEVFGIRQSYNIPLPSASGTREHDFNVTGANPPGRLNQQAYKREVDAAVDYYDNELLSPHEKHMVDVVRNFQEANPDEHSWLLNWRLENPQEDGSPGTYKQALAAAEAEEPMVAEYIRGLLELQERTGYWEIQKKQADFLDLASGTPEAQQIALTSGVLSRPEADTSSPVSWARDMATGAAENAEHVRMAEQLVTAGYRSGTLSEEPAFTTRTPDERSDREAEQLRAANFALLNEEQAENHQFYYSWMDGVDEETGRTRRDLIGEIELVRADNGGLSWQAAINLGRANGLTDAARVAAEMVELREELGMYTIWEIVEGGIEPVENQAAAKGGGSTKEGEELPKSYQFLTEEQLEVLGTVDAMRAEIDPLSGMTYYDILQEVRSQGGLTWKQAINVVEQQGQAAVADWGRRFIEYQESSGYWDLIRLINGDPPSGGGSASGGYRQGPVTHGISSGGSNGWNGPSRTGRQSFGANAVANLAGAEVQDEVLQALVALDPVLQSTAHPEHGLRFGLAAQAAIPVANLLSLFAMVGGPHGNLLTTLLMNGLREQLGMSPDVVAWRRLLRWLRVEEAEPALTA